MLLDGLFDCADRASRRGRWAISAMLQAVDLTLDDFERDEGCNDIINITRPSVVQGVRDGYFATGCDAVETNTFGANTASLIGQRGEHEQ
jgi:methionine synthase I (cobalamin-dependent)